MENQKKPEDWDWVTARNRCSVALKFEELRVIAKANIESRNSQVAEWTKNPRFGLSESQHFRHFAVVDVYSRFPNHCVTVTERDGTIEIENGITQKTDVYTLALNDAGECDLTTDGKVYQPWQVMRRALEAFLFSPVR